MTQLAEKYDCKTDETYGSNELEPTETVEQDLSELIHEASTPCFTEFQDKINKKLIDMPINYKLECLEGTMKCEEFSAFEKELKETLKGY
jgi:hypothetical protein